MIHQPEFPNLTTEHRIVNVASVPQRSPFRYAGGKTWLVPYFRSWMATQSNIRTIVEPFCGGGIISLTAVMENMVQDAVMGELDPHVASVWKIILSDRASDLADKILEYPISRERVCEDLSREPVTDFDSAFQTIVRNRVQRGGIIAPGASLMKNGENGKGITSRWYPKTLSRRIKAIAECRERITFIEGDAAELIQDFKRRKTVLYFVDPPYTAGGKKAGSRLYNLSTVNHEHLFADISSVQGKFMMTYDDAPEVLELARRNALEITRLPMKNTHHSQLYELILTKKDS